MSNNSVSPRDAVIVDFARTAMGRSKGGCFRHTRADELSAQVMKGLLSRNTELDPTTIDDVIWGVLCNAMNKVLTLRDFLRCWQGCRIVCQLRQ